MRLEQYLSYSNLFEAKLQHEDIPEDNQNGTCFQDAMQYMMRHGKRGDDKILLVHGLVVGQGSIKGIVYNHAWIEDGDTVIDETVPIKMPAAFYYRIGKINKKTVFKYTYDEMAKKVSKFKTYGPWEPVLIKNKY